MQNTNDAQASLVFILGRTVVRGSAPRNARVRLAVKKAARLEVPGSRFEATQLACPVKAAVHVGVNAHFFAATLERHSRKGVGPTRKAHGPLEVAFRLCRCPSGGTGPVRFRIPGGVFL